MAIPISIDRLLNENIVEWDIVFLLQVLIGLELISTFYLLKEGDTDANNRIMADMCECQRNQGNDCSSVGICRERKEDC